MKKTRVALGYIGDYTSQLCGDHSKWLFQWDDFHQILTMGNLLALDLLFGGFITVFHHDLGNIFLFLSNHLFQKSRSKFLNLWQIFGVPFP